MLCVRMLFKALRKCSSTRSPTRTRSNTPFESPRVVIDHTWSDFALGLANRPVHHFAALFPLANGDGNVRCKSPARLFTRKVRFRHQGKLSSVSLFLFLFLAK